MSKDYCSYCCSYYCCYHLRCIEKHISPKPCEFFVYRVNTELVVGVAAGTSAHLIKHNCLLEAWPWSCVLGLIFTCDFTCLAFVTKEAVSLPCPAALQKECLLGVEEAHI